LLGLRNMYRVFKESRSAARRQASLSVVGDAPEAERLASILDARRGDKDAEIILTVAGGRVSISGDAVEEPEEVALPEASSREAVLHRLAPRIVAALDEDYVIPLGRGYPALRRAACEDLIHHNARQNAVIGLLPIPGADMPAITANQGRMVLGIAAAYGEELSLERARELLGVLAAGFGFRALTRQVVKLVPVGGWAASAAIGYAGTLAMGRAAELYFERGKQELESGELAEIRHRAAKEARAFVSRMRRR
jgi:uncharacterized protein (DUF697 family)